MKRSFVFVLLALVPAMFVTGCGDDANTLTLDTTPPLAPVLEGANKADGVVAVWWEANAEADLAGYHVYVVDNGHASQMNPSPINRNYAAVEVGNSHNIQVYVTAIDFSGNESAPSATRNVGIDLGQNGRDIIDGRPTQK